MYNLNIYVETYDSFHHPPLLKMFKVTLKKDLFRRFMNISIDNKLGYALRIYACQDYDLYDKTFIFLWHFGE